MTCPRPDGRTALRAAVTAVLGTTLVGMSMSGCSVADSATATATPTPASTEPFPTPTPTPTPTSNLTPTTLPTPVPTSSWRPTLTRTPTSTATATPRATATPTPSPTPNPTPGTGRALDTFALVQRVTVRSGDRFSISYVAVVLCPAKGRPGGGAAAVKACAGPKGPRLPDGSWVAQDGAALRTDRIAADARGTLYPGGVAFGLTRRDLRRLPARTGVLADWTGLDVPAQLSFDRTGRMTRAAGRLIGR